MRVCKQCNNLFYRWIVAYQEAFAFRSSHYFISYLSEAAMITGGFGYENGKKKKDKCWSYVVARPFVIELPRSLVQVVVFWNIPMHMWLKNCKNSMLLMMMMNRTIVFVICRCVSSMQTNGKFLCCYHDILCVIFPTRLQFTVGRSVIVIGFLHIYRV